MKNIDRLIEALGLLRRVRHYECEDGYYSCPACPEYYGPKTPGECNCGLDEDNANLDEALRIAFEIRKEGRILSGITKKR